MIDQSNSDIAAANPIQPTPSTVDDQIQTAPQPDQTAQPAQAQPPAVPAGAAQQQVQPPAGPAGPAAPAAQPPNAHKSLFDRILQGMAGGPSMVADPKTGLMSEVPMTKSTITKHILAGAITGIISGAQTPPNPNDPAGTRSSQNMQAMGAGFNATGQKLDELKNKPQAAVDAQTLAKQRAMQNNLLEMQNQRSISILHEQDWDQAAAHYDKVMKINQPILDNIEASSGVLANGQSLIVEGGRKVPPEQAMKMLEGHHGEYQMIQDGQGVDQMPTYSVVRNSGTVNVDRIALAGLAPYNKDIANLLANSSVDSVPMSITQLLNLNHDAHQGVIAENWINDIRAGLDKAHKDDEDWKELGKVKGFNAAYKDDPAVHSQVDQMSSELGTYGTHSTTSALGGLMDGKKGGALMPFLGASKDDLADFVQDKKDDIAKKDAMAKGAAKIQIQEMKTANTPLTPNLAATILANAKAGKPVAAVDVARATAFQSITQSQTEQKETIARTIKTGDVGTAAKMLHDGTLTLSELKARSTDNKFIIDVTSSAQQMAKSAGEPSWTPQTGEVFLKAASSPQNVAFFGSANSLLDQGGTFDILNSEYSKLGNGQIPLLNNWENYVKYNFGTNPATAGMMQAAIGVADDYGKVMGGGVGTDQSRNQILESMGLMQKFSNAHTPQQMQEVLDTARKAVKSQVAGRIGQNPILQQTYGQDVPEHAKDIKSMQQAQPQAQNPAVQNSPSASTFSPAAWAKANPKGDVNAAIAAAKAQGFQVGQ